MPDKEPQKFGFRTRAFGLLVATGGVILLYYMKKDLTWLPPQVSQALPEPKIILKIGGAALFGLYLCFYQRNFLYRLLSAALMLVSAYCLGYLIRFGLVFGFAAKGASVVTLFLHPNAGPGVPYFLGGVIMGFLVLSAFVGCLAMIFSGTPINWRSQEAIHHRGRGLINYDAALKVAERYSQRSIFFGAIRMPDEIATTHFAIAGATGSGKTLTMRMLMQSVLARVGEGSDTRALIYDAKQDILSILHGMGINAPIVTLNPFDTRCVAWDMAKDITAPATAQQVATILIPEEKHSSSPFFSDAARALLTGVFVSFIQTAPGAWTFRDILYAMRSTGRVREILKRTKETEDLIGQYFVNDRTANDVMSTVATKLQRYQYIAAAWDKARSRISLREWLNDEYILVLGNDEATRTALDAINRVIFKRLSELIIAQTESETRRTWVFLDELRQAGYLDGLGSLLTMGRSKGACVVVGFQDIEGLAGIYGEKEAAEITGLCANKAFLRMDSPKTAQWASSILGEREVLEQRYSENESEGEAHHPGSFSLFGAKSTNASKSKGLSEHLVKRELVLPSEFLSMPTTTRENGLTGYYLTPLLGAYKVHILPEHLAQWLVPPNIDVPNVIPRPETDQYLRPWDAQDYGRLHVSEVGEVAASAYTDSPQEQNLENGAVIQEGSVLREIRRK